MPFPTSMHLRQNSFPHPMNTFWSSNQSGGRLAMCRPLPSDFYNTNFFTQMAWPLIGNFVCPINAPCPVKAGGTSFSQWALLCWFHGSSDFSFSIFSKAQDTSWATDATRMLWKVIHKIPKYNGKISEFTFEDLRAVESRKEGRNLKTTVKAALRRQMISLDGNHFKSLFATEILAWSIRWLIIIWCAYYFSSSFQSIVWVETAHSTQPWLTLPICCVYFHLFLFLHFFHGNFRYDSLAVY